MLLNEFVGKKLLDYRYQLQAYCIEHGLKLLIMELNDVNIDVEEDRLCCWIDDNGIIVKFTKG